MLKFFVYSLTMVVIFMSSSLKIEAAYLTRFFNLPSIQQTRIVFATLGLVDFALKTNITNIADSRLTFPELKEKLNEAYEDFKDSLIKEELNEKEIKHKVNDARLKQAALLRALLEYNPQFLQELIDSESLPQDHNVIFPDKEDLFILLRKKQQLFFMPEEEIIKIISSSNRTSIEVFEKFSFAYYHYLGFNKDFIKKSFYNKKYKNQRSPIEDMQDELIGTLGYELQLFFYDLFVKDPIAKEELINAGKLPEKSHFIGATGYRLHKNNNFHYGRIRSIVCE